MKEKWIIEGISARIVKGISMKDSPTALSKKLLEAEGNIVARVEHWNAFAKCRQDLWGADLIACKQGGPLLFIQCTTLSNISTRRKKVVRQAEFPILVSAGIKYEIHGWAKDKSTKDWVLRRILVP